MITGVADELRQAGDDSVSDMRIRDARTFVGVSVGGGRGKTTAVARIEARSTGQFALVEARVRQGERGGGLVENSNEHAELAPFQDDVLLAYLRARDVANTVLAVDVPLTLPPCIRCQLECPGVGECVDPSVEWMRRNRPVARTSKSALTPYTQRACEMLLTRAMLAPRETLGQGMGPLSARAAFLRRALAGAYELHRNLIEVHPRATLVRLFGEQAERETRRGALAAVWQRRREMLDHLTTPIDLIGVWPDLVVRNVHVFHAAVAAFSAMFWQLDNWQGPSDLLDPDHEDEGLERAVGEFMEKAGPDGAEWGWIWVPPVRAQKPSRR